MVLRVTGALLVLLLFVPSAHADNRVALVIGNSAYAKVGRLPNPASDADAVEALLRAAGFSVVEARRDLGVVALRRALRDFSERVRGADIAVVFYAGHGIEVNGANYLIPVDATLERDIDVEDEAVPLERITQVLEQAKRLRLVILDACRDNPFMRSMKRTLSGRSIGRGLAKVEVLTSDTLIAFAAKAGSTAADGEGANSPYTLALVKHLTTPGLDLRLAFGRVRDEVLKSTGNKQEPFVYGSLGGGEIVLVPSPTPQPPVAPRPAQPASDAAEAWDRTKDMTSIAALEAFIARYSNTYYADLARLRIEELKKQQQVAVASPPPPHPAPIPEPKSAPPAAVVPAAPKPAPTPEPKSAPSPSVVPAVSTTPQREPQAGTGAEPQADTARDGDPLKLLGVWKCHATYRTVAKNTGELAKTGATSSQVTIDRYDGKYYWAHTVETGSEGVARTKSKYWADGGKLYRLVYWTSVVNSRKHINRQILVARVNDKLSSTVAVDQDQFRVRLFVTCSR